jgi:hypothetical protein
MKKEHLAFIIIVAFVVPLLVTMWFQALITPHHSFAFSTGGGGIASTVDGACGSANGQSYAINSGPTYAMLCSSGTSGVLNSPPTNSGWSWNCIGSGGGTTASCSASVAVTAGCGSDTTQVFPATQTPTNLCASGGSATGLTFNATTGAWTWSCSDSSGGTPTNCTTVGNGQCGADNGLTFNNFTPLPTNLCATGTPSLVSIQTNPSRFTWSCQGASTAHCTAFVNVSSSPPPTPAPIDGACGTANGKTYVEGAYSGLNSYIGSDTLCSSGTPNPANPQLTYNKYQGYIWLWQCMGSNGGSSSGCVAYSKLYFQ